MNERSITGGATTELGEQRRFRLNGLLVEPANDRVIGGRRKVHLEPRAMDVLALLAQHPGEVVTRDRLCDEVWAGYPGADQSLTNAVSKIRKALDEVGGDPGWLRTVPKRGYCLETSVEPVGPVCPARVGHLALVSFVVAIAVVAGLVFVGTNARSGAPRLVLLPFADPGTGADPDLARGIGQELGSRLASFGQFELVWGDDAALPSDGGGALDSIAASLDADYLLTGSLRFSGSAAGERPGEYRIATQLIRADDRSSVWGEVFTAPAGQLFDLEADIAAAVAGAMPGAGNPGPSTGSAPTDNERAYRYFLRAIGLSRRYLPSADQVADAYFALRRAVELDPEFAKAWAELSIVLGLQERWDLGGVEITAEEALARALELAPREPDVLVAEGLYHVRHGQSRASAHKAMAALLAALERRPNSARAMSALARALRQAGAFRLAVDVAEAALRRAPADGDVIGTAAAAHSAVRHWERAEALRARLIELEPERYLHWQGRARMRLRATGSVAEARAILARAPAGLIPAKVQAEYDLYERDFAGLVARAEPIVERLGLEGFVAEYPVLSVLAGFAYRELGDEARADRIAAASIRAWEAGLADHPDNPLLLDGLARAQLLAGHDAQALATACRAARLKTGHVSARLARLEAPARIAALVGREDAALRLIERLLAADYGLTPLNRHALLLQPSWDPLRDLDRFQALVRNAPVARHWSGEPVATRRLMERVRDVLEAPPVEIPPLEPLCDEQRLDE